MAKIIIQARMQQRRDTLANWAAANPVLLDGEMGIVTDDENLYKIGDGVTARNDLKFRGFDGTIVQTTGDSESVVMSQKAVTEAVAAVPDNYPQVSSLPSLASVELQPNRYYIIAPSGISALTITLGPKASSVIVNEYVFELRLTSDVAITLPDSLLWANDEAPAFTSGKTYIVSIINNLAVFAEFTQAS